MTKLEATAEALGYLFNRAADNQQSSDNHLSMVAETLLAAYPEKVQKALLVLLVLVPEGGKGNVLLSPAARAKLVAYLTDEVNVWGE